MSAPGRQAGALGTSAGLSMAHKHSAGATGGGDFSHSSVNRRRSFAAQVASKPLHFLGGMNFASSGAIPEECVGASDPRSAMHVLLEVRKRLVRMMTTLASLWRRPSFPWLVLTCMTLLGGCATLELEQSTPPVTVSEVIQLSKAGVPTDTILDKMRQSQTVYRLTASPRSQRDFAWH
jgi:hypothetical protein